MRHLTFSLAMVAVLFLACVATGPGGKTSMIIIPTAQEVAIGAGMAEELSRTEKTLADAQWQAYITEVGQRVVAVCDRKNLTYSFTVIESDQINAFAAPGGYIYFYTGLLRRMKSESELAAVMAHEISHVVARHGVKRLQTAMGVTIATELVFGDESSAALQTAVGIGLGLASAGYSRAAEREADNYGITYMVKAGYSPQGAVEMFRVLAAAGGESGGSSFEGLISSHPDTQERIANALKQISLMQLSSSLQTGTDRYGRMLARLPGN